MQQNQKSKIQSQSKPGAYLLFFVVFMPSTVFGSLSVEQLFHCSRRYLPTTKKMKFVKLVNTVEPFVAKEPHIFLVKNQSRHKRE